MATLKESTIILVVWLVVLCAHASGMWKSQQFQPGLVSMSNQTPEQRETVAQLELGRSERIDSILGEWMRRGHSLLNVYIDGATLPYRALCGDLQGKGDSRREAEAQLAQKLSLPG